MKWRYHAFWLLSLLLTGCTLIQPAPSLPTPVRPPDIRSTGEALGATLEGLYPPDALTIRYEIGSETWGGRTTLTVQGNGVVEVTFDRTDQHGSWTSTLSEDEFLALVRLLVDHKVWAIRGQRETGLPDEAYPTVIVEAEGFDPLNVGMWQAEAQEHADFGPIVKVLAQIALDVSGGVAY